MSPHTVAGRLFQLIMIDGEGRGLGWVGPGACRLPGSKRGRVGGPRKPTVDYGRSSVVTTWTGDRYVPDFAPAQRVISLESKFRADSTKVLCMYTHAKRLFDGLWKQ